MNPLIAPATLREQLTRMILAIKNPAHRVNAACGVNFGMDDHWQRRPGAARRSKLLKISCASRRRNLRGRS